MENYICINGKKAELTEEQMKALGIELPKANPFAMERDASYWFITSYGTLAETNSNVNREGRHNAGNYCTDHDIMKQRACHEILNRLLWRYALENGGEGNFEIAHNGNNFLVQNAIYKYFGQTFVSHNVAENAIKEIIEPFMKANPDFKF